MVKSRRTWTTVTVSQSLTPVPCDFIPLPGLLLVQNYVRLLTCRFESFTSFPIQFGNALAILLLNLLVLGRIFGTEHLADRFITLFTKLGPSVGELPPRLSARLLPDVV